MQTITIQRIETSPEDVVTYPDFLLCLLLQSGVGKIEPDWESSGRKQVDWVFTSRISGGQKTLASCPVSWLRSIFARFAIVVNIRPYCGHVLFKVKFGEDEEPSNESFSLFLCNEPTMEIWMKLYFYGIDNKWPFDFETKPA
jgi:hypothetical protein